MASGVVLQRLVRARDFIHAELERGPTLAELARTAGLSRAHLARQFAATFGVPPHQYVVQLRIDRAKRALAAGQRVTDVCFGLGFASLGSFSTSFHRRTGMSPRAWQRRSRPFAQSLGIPMLFVPACYFPRASSTFEEVARAAGA
jgi:AraC-like DNA-binding protein